VNLARSRWLDSAWRVTAFYTLAAIATTWPLVTRLTTSLPSDLGDPLLNCFIIDWGVDHLRTLADGNLAAFRDYWDAPIFHPEPLALAYSEHLFAQVIQAAPIVWATDNILLAYNFLFLSTFVLSGLGMYLLSRELTGSGAAGFVAGLLYAFALYRVAQYPHLQALSSQWLPFVFFGLRRFFVTGSFRTLAGATTALAAQNLSNGYYLIFFTPFVAAYCIYEIADRRLWTNLRVLAGLTGAGLLTILVTLPFLVPYLVLRWSGFDARALSEVRSYSADLFAWLSAAPRNRVWGWLQTFPKAEGELFPGAVTPLLAAAALVARTRTLWRLSPPARRRWHPRAAALLTLVAAAIATFVVVVLWTDDAFWTFLGQRVTLRAPWKAAVLVATLAASVLAFSPFARTMAVGIRGSALGFFAAAAVVSAALTFGPVMEAAGTATGLPTPYGVLYRYVPGFNGLRVPARYAMMTACCLAVLGGFGIRALLSRGRAGAMATAALALAFVVESTSAPMNIDDRMAADFYQAGPPKMFVGAAVPEVYQYAAGLPAGTVIAEFPFGSPAWDLQFMFYQRVHRHPIVNGYSGGFPRTFDDNKEAFRFLSDVPEVAWRRLLESGATHVIVHRAAFIAPDADVVERWLTARGATMIRELGTDRVYAVPQA
jgi:hypothetical protein